MPFLFLFKPLLVCMFLLPRAIGPKQECSFDTVLGIIFLGRWKSGVASALQNQTLLSRLETILQQHSPRKKSILEEALMPISPPTAASTEQNTCTSPPQQLFNNSNNRPRLSSERHSMVSTSLSLFPDSNLLHLLFLLLPHCPPTHVQCGEPCSPGFVRRHCWKNTKLTGEVKWCKVSNTGKRQWHHPSETNSWLCMWNKASFSPKTKPTHPLSFIIPSPLCPFVCLTVSMSEELNKTAVKPVHCEWRWQVKSCFSPLLPALWV